MSPSCSPTPASACPRAPNLSKIWWRKTPENPHKSLRINKTNVRLLFDSRLTRVMEGEPACGLGRGHGRPARQDPNPSAGCRCHTPMNWVAGVPPGRSFGKRARRPFPHGLCRPSYSPTTPANARVQGLPTNSMRVTLSKGNKDRPRMEEDERG